MGRPPSNGGPSFRFNPSEVAEMEGILQAHNCLVPQREILVALAEKFSNSAERSGKPAVQMKQVWNWFQNRRYALRAKSAKPPVKLNVSPMPQHDLATARNVSQAPQHSSVPTANVRNVPQVPQLVPTPTVQSVARSGSENSQLEFEAKSARDGAWYDVATFLSHRSLETGDPEVLVRFAGFGAEEDEWVNVRKHVRQRSLPCESSECVAVLPGDLILCFQEGKEQALYFDAHVLDAQRRRHDVRGCRCRFLVRYDHDQSEEIVPLRKVCRRPETDYRMQQLHAESANMKQSKTGSEPHSGDNVKAYPPAEATSKQPKVDGPAETISKLANAEVHGDCGPLSAPVSYANIPVMTSGAHTAQSSEPLASATAPSPDSNVPVAPTTFPDANASIPGATVLAPVASSVLVAPTAASMANSSVVASVTSSVPVPLTVVPVAKSSVPGATVVASVADSCVPIVPTTTPATNSNVPIVPTIVSTANPGVPIVPTVAPTANSSVPVVPTMASAANSSVPPASTAEAPVPSTAEAPAVNSSVPVASTAEAPAAGSRVPVAGTAEAPDVNIPSVPPALTADAPLGNNSSVPIASTAEAPVANNSSVVVAEIAEAPNPNNSSVPGVATEAPVASNTPPGTEFKVLLDRVSDSGPANNVDNTNAQNL